MIIKYRKELLSFLQSLNEKGFTSYITNEGSNFLYATVLHPNGAIIYIQRNAFSFLGWDISQMHKPSKKNGSSSSLTGKFPLNNLSYKLLENTQNHPIGSPHRYNNVAEYLVDSHSFNKGFISLVQSNDYGKDLYRAGALDKIKAMEDMAEQIEVASKRNLLHAYISSGYKDNDCFGMIAGDNKWHQKAGYVLYDNVANKPVFISINDVANKEDSHEKHE